MSYLTNPLYTQNQWLWSSGMGGSIGTGFQTGMNNGNLWGAMGWTPSVYNPTQTNGTTNGTTNGNAASSGNADKDEEMKEKYTKLSNFLKKLSEYEDLPSEDKTTLKTALKHKFDKDVTWEGRLDYLKEQYKKISKNTVKEYIIGSGSLTTNGTSGGKNIAKLLIEAGYESPDSPAIPLSDIKDLESSISKLNDANAHIESATIIGDLALNSSRYEILDVISRWNTVYKNDPSKRNIIKFMKSKYDSADKTMREDIKTGGVSPIIKNLMDKAETLKNNKALSADRKQELEKLIEEVSAELSKSGITEALANKFDDLYACSRKAAIAIARNEINKYYGDIDPDIFNDTLFESETNKDLEEEFAKNTNRVNYSNTVTGSTTGTGNSNGANNTNNNNSASANGQLDDLADAGKLKKTTVSNKTYYVTLDGKKAYYVDNGSIKVVVYSNNKIDETKAEDASDAEISKMSIKLTNDEIKTAADLGGQIRANLLGYTKDKEMNEVKKCVQEDINSNNVLYVLQSYEKGRLIGNDYCFEQLLSENDKYNAGLIAEELRKYVVEFVRNNIDSITNDIEKRTVNEALEKLEDITINSEGKVVSPVTELNGMSGKEIDKLIFKLIEAFNIKEIMSEAGHEGDWNKSDVGRKFETCVSGAVSGGAIGAGIGATAGFGVLSAPFALTGGVIGGIVGAIGGYFCA
jgi:hypothetical protein